mgnify:FL=1
MEKSSIDLLKKVSKIVDNIINNKKKGEKEMKLKTKKILASIIICIMLLFQTGIVNAAYTVGVRGLRDDPERVQRVVETLPNTSGEQVPTEGDTIPYAYILEGTKMIWKLLDYSSGEASWDTAIYCLDQGVGFGTSGASREEVEAERVLYNTSEVMQIKKRSIQNLAAQNTNSLANYSVLSAMNDIDTYNRVLWILDHCFLPKSVHREELRKELLTNMLTFKDENEDTGILDDIDLSAVGSTPEEILLTDNDIEMVQQAAIWYFTNFSEEANWTGLPSVTLEDASEAEKNLSDIGLRVTDEGAMREAEAALLYKYFITQAVEEQAQYSIERELVPTLTMENTNVTIEKTGNNTLIGPFKYVIVENGKKVFNYSLEVNAATNNTSLNPVSNYTIKKSDKTTTANNIEEVKNQDFYILIEDENITNVEIKVKTKYYKPTVTKWTAEGTGREEQPIAIISEQEFDLEASKGAELKKFDLALRKFISGVNEEEVTNRVPQVSYEDGKIVYTHTKEPVVVKNGDTVIYTLRVYNEGEVAGYAEEIKDLIPEGTEFLPEHEINTKYGWKMYKIENEVEVETDIASEATILRTDYLSKASGEGRSENTLINAFNSEGGITEENPDYQEVKIAVKVIAPSTTEGVLRNIAEISEDANENGDPIDDIDSTPDNYPEDEDDEDYDDIVLTYFDLALRKFITKINDKEITDRIPEVDITSLNKAVDGQTITTAEYSHPKNPVSVQKGDIVTYTIRIYNEGELDGYAEEIADYIPEGLGYLVQHNTNFNNSWQLPNDGSILPENLMDVTNRLDNINLDEFTDVESLEDILVVPGNAKITTNKLKKTEGNTNNLLEAFNGTELDYKDVQVTCIVLEDETSDRILTNVAEITKDLDEEGNEITDRDSEPDSVIIDEYPVNSNVQDDDDYEKLMLTYFDLALRKFITGVNEEEITDRVPQITMENEELVYNHTKEPIAVRNGDTVIYTLRIYNEGKMAGYAEEIKDLIPEGTEFLPEHEINIQYGWRMYKIENDEEIETTDATEATIVRTDYLSKAAGETRGEDNLLKAFDNIAEITPEGTFYHPDYRDVKIAVKIIEPNTSEEVLRNIAEISEDADEEGEPVDDVDSTPDNYPEEEDDNDYDDVVLTYFDLALRKFITSIRDLDVEEEVTERIPQVSYEDGKIVYTHPKDPILVANGNIVTYTIRVYNEGKMDGYASEITDDIPEGLEFLPEHETNKQYGWVVSEDGTKVTTNYLSKEASEARGEDNLIKAFDPEEDVTEENPDYRDVKIAFKVTEEQLPEDRILINTAEISDDSDEDGNEIEDEDSIPGNNEPEEDDIDIEKVQVKYFDLSLLKYVSKVITIENGETQIKETGYDGTEDPEPIVKVDLHRKKVDEVTVKFGYTIKITNEGQIPGYATEIKDYVPEGLEFLPEDNPDWLEIENGIIVTEKLAETLLQPGESATVEVILTWINDEDNMGLKTNIAEISKDDNEYDSDDIDSTPDNKEEGEDDIDEALVMLSISTGGESKVYIALSGIILVTIAVGIVLIKKFVI